MLWELFVELDEPCVLPTETGDLSSGSGDQDSETWMTAWLGFISPFEENGLTCGLMGGVALSMGPGRQKTTKNKWARGIAVASIAEDWIDFTELILYSYNTCFDNLWRCSCVCRVRACVCVCVCVCGVQWMVFCFLFFRLLILCIFASLTDLVKHCVLTLVNEIQCYRNYHYKYYY